MLRSCGRNFVRFCRFWSRKKFGGNEKKRTFAVPNEKRVAVEAGSSYEDWRLKEDFSKIFSKKFGSSKIKRTFATPFEKRVLERGFRKFIEKTVLLYKKQVPRKYNLSRSVNFFVKL